MQKTSRDNVVAGSECRVSIWKHKTLPQDRMVTAASSATIAKELITLTNKQFQGDSEVCPICCEPWDEQDRRFFPCHCGYQVCMFCWKKIKEEANGRCPACREIYTEEPQFKTPAETEGVNSADNSENNSPEDASSINGDSSAVG